MEQGYKHFSHSHNLVMHQLPEGVDISCSGCNTSGNGTVYICRQCNFFLHEQCYRATRSLKHPSHPLHPITLVPYPTYPSNSFYCNSCEITGTGLSYSCANCEFDLHVQCAYSISRATSSQKAQQYPTNYYNPYHQEPVPPIWNGQNSSMPHNLAFVSVPDGHQNPLTPAQNPYMDQKAHCVSIPNPITSRQYHSTGQNQSTTQIGHSVSISNTSQYSSVSQNGPSVSIPTKNQNPITSDQKVNWAQNIASASVPAASPDYQPDNHVESGQNQLDHKGIMHFSHPHSLRVFNLLDKENDVDCSGCEKTLDGKGYSCVEQNCNFHLHESCFYLKQQIQHKSHPEHPLTLLPIAPYNKESGEFSCNACFSDGRSFTYHCSVCKFDLHVQCVSLPETVKRSDHEHMLKLYYSCPVKGEEFTFSCDVCHVAVQKDGWGYYCESCDYGTHLGCVDREESIVDSILDTQVLQLQRLQLQMEMVRQNAQMMTTMSMGTSFSGHVWFADSGGI